ncbi:MAG TPA: hypothetical protein VGR53_06815 [Nitrososphaerales archaeon]|nr:hypothetical protein [Nitrososphaerales archaeon]
MLFRRWTAGILAIGGGILMIGSGYSSRSFLYFALGYTEPRIVDFLSGKVAEGAVFAIAALELIIALGGVTVALGGIIILVRHSTTGRILIFLGGGAGFLGLLISFGYSTYKLGGLGPALSYLPYWVGLASAVLGRRLAKGV